MFMALMGNVIAYADNESNSAVQTVNKAYTVETLPITSTFGRDKFVCNPDGILDAVTVDSIKSIMQLLEEDTHCQVLFVAVNAIQPADEKEFAVSLGNKLGVGDTTNNGLVVLLVKDLRAIYMATGLGMEKVMSSSKCKSIQERYMIGSFKNADWNGGMLKGAVAIDEFLRGGSTKSNDQPSSSGGSMGWIGLAAAGILGYFLMKKGGRKCPKCEKKTFKLANKEYFMEGEKEKIRFTYKCSSCGHEEVVIEDRYKKFGGGKFDKDAGAGTRF